jgi:hypothetical protein
LDETERIGAFYIPEPGKRPSPMEALDLESLRRKYHFLNDFSDNYIRSTPLEVLLKAELSSRKLQDMDKNKRAEEKLAHNRDTLDSNLITIQEGVDNRLDRLHPARFLPGATCSAGKLWLQARSVLGEKGHPPLSTYDMASFGLGGCVTSKGWVSIHDPACPNLSIKMFSMGNCGSRASKSDEEFPEMENLAEFKSAIRVLRGAMLCVHPWNRSIDALESFLVQSNFCAADLAGKSKQVAILTHFTDYVLAENSNRWRGMEVFLSTRDLRNTWADFFGQKAYILGNKPGQGKDGFLTPSQRYNLPPSLFQEDICVLFNLGRCPKQAGSCFTKKGTALRHVCNYRADPAKRGPACGQSNACFLFHK